MDATAAEQLAELERELLSYPLKHFNHVRRLARVRDVDVKVRRDRLKELIVLFARRHHGGNIALYKPCQLRGFADGKAFNASTLEEFWEHVRREAKC